MTGLTNEQVQQRIEEGKINVNENPNTRSYKQIVRENVLTFFNFLNLALMIMVLLVGSYKNSMFMGIIVINTVIGIIQEVRAKKTLDKLAILTESKAVVLREGKKWSISTEKLVLDDISTGASNDLERATAIARSMVMRYGFSERLGPVVYGNEPSETFLGRDLSAGRGYSETVASEIDAEIREMLDEAYEAARVMLSEHIDKLHTVAKALMEREKLSGEEFRILMEGGTLPPLDKDDAPRADAEKAEDEKSSAPRRRVSVHVKEPAVQEPASVQSETPSAEEAPKE